MAVYFNSRTLSRHLGINLAKWKRWAREFLPPDPLGGLQSGYARQYNVDEAFVVALGGHLVGNLKFTIPEAKRILKDLNGWLVAHGFFYLDRAHEKPEENMGALIKSYEIHILRKKTSGEKIINFSYMVRGLIAAGPIEYKGYKIQQQLYVDNLLTLGNNEVDTIPAANPTILNITQLLISYVEKLSLSKRFYPEHF
ncbi:MAG: hypothetical protein Q8P24_11790 [Desulfobacterales bacterium]|nr:hypothetical protein [Desulfobacterales bacterium]